MTRFYCTFFRSKPKRIVWEIDVPGNHNVRYLVGKNYEATLAKHSTLRNDLRTWFGQDINAHQFDTATLKGKEAILTVQDIENEGWANPYHHVAKVEPLVDEDGEDAEDARSISPQERKELCPQEQVSFSKTK